MHEEQWVTPQQVADVLGCSVETVRSMLRDGLLAGEKVGGAWRVPELEVALFPRLELSMHRPETEQKVPRSRTQGSVIEPGIPEHCIPPSEVDPEMLQVTMALTGMLAAIAGFLPRVADAPELIKLIALFVATLAAILSFFSAYTALWLLARYCLKSHSLVGLEEILALLGSPTEVGPYWFVALGLLVWMMLSVLLFVLVLVG